MCIFSSSADLPTTKPFNEFLANNSNSGALAPQMQNSKNADAVRRRDELYKSLRLPQGTRSGTANTYSNNSYYDDTTAL